MSVVGCLLCTTVKAVPPPTTKVRCSPVVQDRSLLCVWRLFPLVQLTLEPSLFFRAPLTSLAPLASR